MWIQNEFGPNVKTRAPVIHTIEKDYDIVRKGNENEMVCILLPKLFWPTVRKKNGLVIKKNFLRSLEQFIQTVKGQNNFW